MTQTMILVGVLAICAISGVLLTRRPRRTHGPDEPTGSYPAPPPPVPILPPAAAAPTMPPVTAAAPGKPSQPLPAPLFVPARVPAPAPAPTVPVRRGRNNGFARFTPPGARARAGSA